VTTGSRSGLAAEERSPLSFSTPPSAEALPREARSGLDPYTPAELPVPPNPKGLGWIPVVGPGVILLGLSIGSGEFLLGPAMIVKHGPTVLWIAGCAIVLQTLFNLEVMRYTLAVGEPVFSGFMRTGPSATAWAWIYAVLYFLQVGWPAWAANAAGAVFFLHTGRLATGAEANTVYLIGLATYAICFALLLLGKRIERTLEILNWILVGGVLTGFTVLALLFAPGAVWGRTLAGFVGYDPVAGTFDFLPADLDLTLLGAFAAFTGAGGMANLTLSNWARDKGYGMSRNAGYIPSATGHKVALAHGGFRFEPSPEAMSRWRGWWRIVRVDQWGVFFVGAALGMALPAMLYLTFVPAGTTFSGLGAAATLAESSGRAVAPILGVIVALMAVWVLFKTQLDSMEGLTRAITDILWTGSRRLRAWRGGDVRAVYYSVLIVGVTWGAIALKLVQPFLLLQLAANMAGVVFVIASLHLLYINCTLLPPDLRPPLSRRIALVVFALFYGTFVTLWLGSLLGGAIGGRI
jgi:hypothetical protein